MSSEKHRRGVKVAGVSPDGARRGLSDGPGKLWRTGAADSRGVDVRRMVWDPLVKSTVLA